VNIYSCWYGGVFGYCCRSYKRSWMFVPESGQFRDKISENLILNDLVFKNKQEKLNEVEFEKNSNDSANVKNTDKQNIFNLNRFSELMGIS
jgi:hypothetical protein